MDLHYKTYQKIKIYLDKIFCALPILNLLANRTTYAQNQASISARFIELSLFQVQLIDFLSNHESLLPYVPTSRCKSIGSFYLDQRLHNNLNSASFQKLLIESDKQVFEAIGYIIPDIPKRSVLKIMFKKHLKRFTQIQASEIGNAH